MINLQVKDDGIYLKPLDQLIKQLCCQFPVPLHYAWIRDKTKIEERKLTKRSIQKEETIENRPDMNIENFSIDVTPGPSIEKVTVPEKISTDVDFIPLKSITHSSNCEDYMKNLLYIAPNFIRMQKNCNRQKKIKIFDM